MTELSEYFAEELAAADGALEAVHSMEETRRQPDRDAEKTRGDKEELMRDRTTDPLKLGQKVSALDHALAIIADRRALMTEEIAAEEAKLTPKLIRLASAVKSTAEAALSRIRSFRHGRVMALAEEFGCAWARGAEPKPGEPLYHVFNIVTAEMENLNKDSRLEALRGLAHDGAARCDYQFPHLANAGGTIAMGSRLTAALKAAAGLLPPPPEPEPTHEPEAVSESAEAPETAVETPPAVSDAEPEEAKEAA